MQKAIILNAGEGKRLRPLTRNIPKSLIKIGNKTILEHQLSNLITYQIKEIIIVVGYRSEMIIQKALKEFSPTLSFKFIYNPIYYKTNTAYSLWLAKDEMNGDFIYLNGDVLFHKYVIQKLLYSRYKTCFAIVKKRVGEEEVKVKTINDKIVKIGKEIDPSIADGEFIGIAKFSRNIVNDLKNQLENIIKEKRMNAFFELAVQRLLRRHNIYSIDVSDIPCIEIDTHDDLDKAKRIYLEMSTANI